MRIIPAIAAAAAVLLAATACAAQPADPKPARIITATGTGTATGTPDTVSINLGVATRAEDAATALQQNNEAANTVVTKLKDFGVAEKDLRTAGLYIYPTYSDMGAEITGYEVSNTVTATLHDVTQAGDLIDTAQQAAGDAIRVDGITFSFDDDSELRSQARAAAVEKAMDQAEELAAAAGLTIGEILSVSEGGTGGDIPIYARAMDDAAGSAPIMPGSADVAVTVQLTVAIG